MTSKPQLPQGFLTGVRIIDFSWKTVGPWATRMLTPYGAEVIHVEPPHRPDDHRFEFRPVYGDAAKNQIAFRDAPDSPAYYTTPNFSHLHAGKLAINLNTRHPEGKELMEQLVKVSDGLSENFSGGVLDSWGLGWDRLKELNPKLVYLSLSGYGHKGEWGSYRSYGPSAQASSGLTFSSGLPDKNPAGWGYSYMDVTGGWCGGLGMMMGLLRMKRTGEGVYVDYAVTEAAMAMLGPFFLDYQVNNRPTRRPGFPPGNRSIWPEVAPHNTYRCAGIDRQGQDWFVFIACETQEQWESLVEVMGKPELLGDPRFITMQARRENQDVLDDIISTWTAPRRRYEIMTVLQQAGIIAVPIQNAEDRVEYDEQLRHREMYPVIAHPEVGEFEMERYPPRLSRTPADNTGRAPILKEHEEYVFGELLGIDSVGMSRLREGGVI